MELEPLCWTDAPAALDGDLLPSSGAIPETLDGAVVRNGPGRFRAGPDALNFFDAHGYVAGVSFRGGRASLRARLVETAILAEHTATGRQTRRGVFTNHPSRWKNLFAVDFAPKNTCMHDCYAWGGKIVAGDQPFHTALDARTLATVGPLRWPDIAPPGTEMCPMPRVDPHTGRLVVWTNAQRPGKPDRLAFHELDDDLRVVRQTERVTLANGPALVHGHAFSERWYAVAEMGASLDPVAALWGARTIWGSLRWSEARTPTLHLLARDGSNRHLRVVMPSGHLILFHIFNAFDDGPRLVLDVASYPEVLDFEVLAPPELLARTGRRARADEPGPSTWRVVVDTEKGVVVDTVRLGPGSEAMNIDARVRGRRNRWLFGPTLAGDGTDRTPSFYGSFHGIVRVDAESGRTDLWSAGPRARVTPPAFAPRGVEEGDGWLLTWVLDADTGGTDLVVLDATRVEAGPVARLPVGAALPPASHNNWFDGVHFGG